MINGDAREFIDGLYYGDERFFIYKGNKYFIQGFCEDGEHVLEIYVIENENNDFHWKASAKNNVYPVDEFENAKIFNGKNFWEIESEIEWVDC